MLDHQSKSIPKAFLLAEDQLQKPFLPMVATIRTRSLKSMKITKECFGAECTRIGGKRKNFQMLLSAELCGHREKNQVLIPQAVARAVTAQDVVPGAKIFQQHRQQLHRRHPYRRQVVPSAIVLDQRLLLRRQRVRLLPSKAALAAVWAQMSPPANLGFGHSNLRTTPPIHQQSLHKRSLSFNHHLSYNQYHTPTQHPPHHQHLPPLSQQNHLLGLGHKSNLVQTSNSISKMTNTAAMGAAAGAVPVASHQGMVPSGRIGSIKANWSITNLRPAPPLRPNLLNNQTSTTGGSSNALSSYCNSRKNQPNFEEDALVLRVIEAYCAAYQNNARNTIHSALQPWTPCLPIRGGKLKTSKPFSTSNPQLPFLCNSGGTSYTNSAAQAQQNSTNSLNSSYIWREASPNNFNMYSTSVSSLNTAYRYSLSGTCGVNQNNTPSPAEYRAMSEERATRKTLNRFKTGSGYDNIFMTPLLPRKNKQQLKNFKNAYQTHQRTPPPLSRNHSAEEKQAEKYPSPGLYDRRLNRSFETPQQGYMKQSTLRRSTPHLAGDDGATDTDSQRHSATWCCGNFVMKQWRKINNY
ncbi:uncharacterized protein LOC129949011 isoform X4 [Eupeodes corollae]|uniref:uncharacterized protein LOC129949011 isoform X4 n=1 Tax=Eupeodes corollae TaxID=290404 RepID=UPI002490DD44|nr:uncharacterized protein LOC129949011 isoform X4 [Eupeodes corollae]